MSSNCRPVAVFALFALLITCVAAVAQESMPAEAAAPSEAEAMPLSEEAQQRLAVEAFEAELGYQSGTIDVGDGLATFEVPAGFRYVGPESARRVLVDAWGNPPGSGEGVLGMLFPAGISPLADEGWGVIVRFDEEGHVDDEDAADIDYADLLKDMQKGTKASNEERKTLGFGAIDLVGWAETPSYDAQAKKLYWAKELAFEGVPGNTVNYDVRVLGRRGVLVLSAVARMEELPAIRPAMKEVLTFVQFNEGHRYEDYVAGTDKAAAYGVAGLIGGAAAVKMGFFKVLIAGILAAKKLIIVGAIALFAIVRRVFRGRQEAGT